MLLMCLIPLQVSWAAVMDYCEHEGGKSAQHFGHHDDEHKMMSEPSNSDQQPGQSDPRHDHCHMSGFLGLLNEVTAPSATPPAPPYVRWDEQILPSLALDRPERPKWFALA